LCRVNQAEYGRTDGDRGGEHVDVIHRVHDAEDFADEADGRHKVNQAGLRAHQERERLADEGDRLLASVGLGVLHKPAPRSPPPSNGETGRTREHRR